MVEYAYRRIASDLEEQIKSGKIPPGGKLPGELELAEVYQVSAGTVRRAVRELRERGLVETLPHLGTFVPEHEEAPPAGSD
ncbi:winged helix-turn-helix domain-containing protein [Streptomyces sp. S1A]|uniref:winged helix-turn-helix domain-containing protein n=1 Tax=Streptomyces sp. ICN903 TaxID=2964654 RepID=UPI001EDA3811|nr:winged helix-turn-helix domain-containing protein [Streptomyces sp. ICN903]MCG3039281.1 winged helix-turn-helix domain-containing protein [Streptomyces sp. ICN903]